MYGGSSTAPSLSGMFAHLAVREQRYTQARHLVPLSYVSPDTQTTLMKGILNSADQTNRTNVLYPNAMQRELEYLAQYFT